MEPLYVPQGTNSKAHKHSAVLCYIILHADHQQPPQTLPAPPTSSLLVRSGLAKESELQRAEISIMLEKNRYKGRELRLAPHQNVSSINGDLQCPVKVIVWHHPKKSLPHWFIEDRVRD